MAFSSDQLLIFTNQTVLKYFRPTRLQSPGKERWCFPWEEGESFKDTANYNSRLFWKSTDIILFMVIVS